jgi:hypothetical protein
MRVLVCGSRHFAEYQLLSSTLDAIKPLLIIEGEARGADKMAAVYAEHHGIPVERYPANWDLHGKAAGPIRNTQMLREGKPDLVVAFLAPNSRGTRNMISQAEKAGVPVKVINI